MVVAQEATQDHEALLAQVDARKAAKAAARATRRKKLAVDFADGVTLSPDEIEQALEEVGMSTAELLDEKKRILRRRELRKVMDKPAANEVRRVEINQQLKAIEDEIKEFIAPRDAKKRALSFELEGFRQDSTYAWTAEQEMVSTAPTELKDEYHATVKAAEKIVPKMTAIQALIDDRLALIPGFRSAATRGDSDLRRREAAKNLSNTEARIQDLLAELSPLKAKYEELRAKSDELRQAMLRP